MSKHVSPEVFFDLPSGNRVHPCRLIHRDGTIMWKHALWNEEGFINLPEEAAHEAHIIKTAQRLEELNYWISQQLEPWEFLRPVVWYNKKHSHQPFAEGYAVVFNHTSVPVADVYDILKNHIQEHETLQQCNNNLYFQRC